MSEAGHIPTSKPPEDSPDQTTISHQAAHGDPVAFRAPDADVSVYPLARGDNWRDTPLARWATSLACRLGLPTDPVGRGVELDGDDLAELQRRAQDAFVRPVYRIVLREPLLAFRFYGDLCLPITRLYTSIATVRQVPRFGWLTKELLGLTGRNGADNLIAVRVAPGSQIAVGGISNHATWADQILVEVDRGLLAVGHLSQAECDSNGRTKRAS